jgi:retron-type reverse transcriptase
MALEDKIAQRATVEVLNAIYEVDFLGFSHGFRPGRSPHKALDALYVAQLTRKVNWVLDADICGFFDAIDRNWLVKFIAHRIGVRFEFLGFRHICGRKRSNGYFTVYRQSMRKRLQVARLIDRYLPKPRIYHYDPLRRLGVIT